MLSGLSLIIDGTAAVWWKGVQKAVNSWDKAVQVFHVNYPAHAVFFQTSREN